MAVTANGVGRFSGTATTNSINLNQATAYALSFSSTSYDDDVFSYAGGNPSQIVVDDAGDYFLAITIPVVRDDANTADRTTVEAEVRVNGTKVDVGVNRSSYIRHSSQSSATNNFHVYLDNLSASDYIEVFVRGLGDNTGTGWENEVVGQHTVLIRKIGSTKTAFSATGVETTNSTNLNQATPYEMEWNVELRKDSGFTHSTVSASEDIVADAAGYYFMTVNIPLGGTAQRMNVIGKVLLDGSEVPGGRFQNGYLRNFDNIADSSIFWSGLVQTTSTNQVISVSVQLDPSSATGTVTVDSEKAQVYIEKLPSDGLFAATGTQVGSSSDDWSPASASEVIFSTEIVKDTGVFTHSASSTDIEVEEAGDYLLSFNVAFSVTDSAQRSAPGIYVNVNDTLIPGSYARTGYLRNSTGIHTAASNSLVFLLEGLSANDIINVLVEETGTNGTVADDVAGLVVVYKLPSVTYTSPQYAYSGKINSGTDTITSAILYEKDVVEPTGASISAWHMSADGGSNWEAVTPGSQHTFSNSGNDLRWRATLSNTDSAVTATINEISVVWLESAGGTSTSSTRAAKITGQDSATSQRSAKTTGSADTNSTRAGKLTGQNSANSTRAAKTTGVDTTSSERAAKTTGSIDSSDERDAKLIGIDTTTSERSAKVTGSAQANDERDAKLTGVQSTSSERAAKTTGQNSASSERDAKLTGEDTAFSTRPAKTIGVDTSSDERNAKITGQQLVNDQRAAKTHGIDTDASERGAKTTGTTAVSSNRNAKTTGVDTTNDQRAAKVTGGIEQSSERGAKLTGVGSTNDDRSAKITGKETSTDERSAKVTGQDSATSERASKLVGQDSATSERSAKIHGLDTTSDERAAKLSGKESSSDERSAKLVGQDNASSSRASKVTGQDTSSDERAAKLEGRLSSTSERAAKLTAEDTTSSERQAKIHGVDTTNDERSATTTGILASTSQRSAKLLGNDTTADERSAKVTGVNTSSDQRSAKTTGGIESSSERGARLTGVQAIPEGLDIDYGVGITKEVFDVEIAGEGTTKIVFISGKGKVFGLEVN